MRMEQVENRFERIEKKYFLSRSQYEDLLPEISKIMVQDNHQNSEVRSVYFDCSNFTLIRHSVEKPYYKEKLRIRSYGIPTVDSEIYVEIKKKLAGTVYKRRAPIQYKSYLENGFSAIQDFQIRNEILSFWNFYRDLRPVCLVVCSRTSWHDQSISDLRVTFDENLRYSSKSPRLDNCDETEPFFQTDRILMEIKLTGAMPLWLARLLSKYEIYPVSFSKYGYIYEKTMQKELISNVVR